MRGDSQFWASYFRERPAYHRMLQALRKKYQQYGYPAGIVCLKDASEEECGALRGLFGQLFSHPVRFRTAQFETELQKSKFPDVCLKDVLELYFGEEIVTNRERRQTRDNRFSDLLHTVMRETDSEACLRWLKSLVERRGSGYILLRREAERDIDGTRDALRRVCQCAEWLEQNNGYQVRLAVLGAQAAADPHALDGNTLCGKLFLHLLAMRANQLSPKNAEQRDALYFQNGILCDSISSAVTQVGLTLDTAEGEHPAYTLLREKHEICTLTLANLSVLTGARSLSGRVYLVENEMVFSQLCDRAADFHSLLACTSGQPSVAALRLLDLLAASGAELYYSGDFDGKGLSIAAQLMARYPKRLKLWHMAPEDYAACTSEIALRESSAVLLRDCAGTAPEKTADAVAEKQRAGYQELLLEKLEKDLMETS